VHIDGDDLSLVRWNHRPALLHAALQIGDHVAWRDDTRWTGIVTNDRRPCRHHDDSVVRIRWDHQLDSETWENPCGLVKINERGTKKTDPGLARGQCFCARDARVTQRGHNSGLLADNQSPHGQRK
jgi:hypothetical protein